MSGKSYFKFDIDHDVQAIRAMAQSLEVYLYEEPLYGNLGDPQLPRMTVGGFLLRLHRLRAICHRLDERQCAILERAESSLNIARAEWQAHYEAKLMRELDARQDSWKWYLDECDDSVARCSDAYPSEAEKRTIIHHLIAEGHSLHLNLESSQERQDRLDGRLRGFFRAGDFIWDPILLPAYPSYTFWWLYGRPDGRSE